jgi:hypothetical protein
MADSHQFRRNAKFCKAMALSGSHMDTRDAWLLLEQCWTAMIAQALLREWRSATPEFVLARLGQQAESSMIADDRA